MSHPSLRAQHCCKRTSSDLLEAVGAGLRATKIATHFVSKDIVAKMIDVSF